MNSLEKSIKNKNMISFSYNGLLRIGEPHICGISGDQEQILVWQTEGDSNSDSLPGWRKFKIQYIQKIKILDSNFLPRLSVQEIKDSKFTTIFFSV